MSELREVIFKPGNSSQNPRTKSRVFGFAQLPKNGHQKTVVSCRIFVDLEAQAFACECGQDQEPYTRLRFSLVFLT